MQGASLAELRDLSRTSRRAQQRGFLAILLVLLSVPIELLVARFVGTWGPALIVVTGGLMFVWYAHSVGQERGAFRRVFRRLSEERKTRRLDVQGPAATAPEEQEMAA